MLLVIDVDNTSVALGVFEGQTLRATWRLTSDVHRTADEYSVLFQNVLPWEGIELDDVNESIIGCVVPSLVHTMIEVCERCFGHTPLLVGAGVKTGLRIQNEQPREVGADRIANAVATVRMYGGPAIIVDFGTATTFDAVSTDGGYLGGAIAPGIDISAEALSQRAAKLPAVELVRPRTAIGRNTVAAMQSGIFFGYVGLVDGIVSRMKAELGSPARVIATGTFAELIAPDSATIEVVDHTLTLSGLWHIFQLNRANV